MLKEIEHDLRLSGTGETRENAMNHIFSQIKPLISQTFAGSVVIRIEPKSVHILSATAMTRTEKFLGLLFPRRRTQYDITLALTVHLQMIDLSEIVFEQRSEERSLAQRILTME
jgi:uncharacterized protein (TIGR03578 family)